MADQGGRKHLAEFRAHGPFRLLTRRNLHGRELDRTALRAFWKQTADMGLFARRCGCYVFAIRVSKRCTPYYVGKTEARFDRECFTERNLRLYNAALARHGKSAAPVMFLVCGRSRKVKRRLISEMETFFIQLGADRNPELLNVKGKPIAKWRIPGVVRGGTGKPTRAAREFRKTFGL